MKRFLSFLMVFMLAFALAVPVGAVNTGTMYYNGVELPELPTDLRYVNSIISKGSNYRLVNTNANELRIDKHGLLINGPSVYYLYNGDTQSWDYSHEYSANSYETNEFFLWSNVDIIGEDGNVFLSASEPIDPSNFVCDGSSCPANDANIDGICDDCGMRLMSLSRAPVVPDVDGTNKHYALFSGTWDGLQGWYYVVSTSSEDYTVRGDLTGDYYKVTYDNQAESSMYVSYDGINWERKAMNFTSSRFVPKNSTTELVDSSHNWYDESGELFFPLPLWMEMLELTEGEMMAVPQTAVGAMKILTVCGVGCLALLTVLKLFGKRSLLFRG